MKNGKQNKNRRETVHYIVEKKILVISAHPDDEILGAGTLLTYAKEPSFLHTTDGAPKDKIDSINAGYYNLEEYSEARRAEFRNALLQGNIYPDSCYYLRLSGQETIYRLEELIFGIASVITEINPDVILTHAYEGGHPDHDTTAFAVHYLLKYLQKRDYPLPELFEFTSYFNFEGKMTAGKFIPAKIESAVILLNEEQIKLKKAMLDQFVTQKKILETFPLEREAFRRAPEYNFLLPPHIGKLYYEYFDWGVTPQKWRSITRNFIENSEFCRELF